MKRSEKKLKSELPYYVISYIFSKLSIKDSVKTSILSKQWLHEWGLRMDLNFDLQNMFDYNAIQELPESLLLQSQFATRVDQFMLHYQGAKIRSIRVNFPLGDEHSDVIDRLISQGISKGAERIELLFSYITTSVTTDLMSLETKQYKFPFTLFPDTNSLKYLHLENCLLVAPMKFSGFKNLGTLVLNLISIKQDLLQGLFSECIHLVDLTLDDCKFKSDLNIISPILHNLNIIYSGRSLSKKINIIASNLLSFEYSCIAIAPKLSSFGYSRKCGMGHSIYLSAPKLSKLDYHCIQLRMYQIFRLKNMTKIVLAKILMPMDVILHYLFDTSPQLEDVTFMYCSFTRKIKIISSKLRHLNIIDCDFDYNSYPPRIDIDAVNLSSFDYSGRTRRFSFKTPRLLKFFWNTTARKKKRPSPFNLIASLHSFENLVPKSGTDIA